MPVTIYSPYPQNSTSFPFVLIAPVPYSTRPVTYNQLRTRLLPSRSVADLLRHGTGTLRLRTNLIFSFIFLTAALTTATLLVVRRKPKPKRDRQFDLDSQ